MFRNLKKVWISVLCFSLVGALVACQNPSAQTENPPQDAPKLKIVTSFYPMYLLTKNIVKGISDVELVNMTEPQTGCLHDYQLSTGDLKLLQNADIFVINGAGMESFMDKVLTQMKDLKIIEASKGIPLIKSNTSHADHAHEAEPKDEAQHKDEADHQDEANHKDEATQEEQAKPEWNPHVWVSISGAIAEVKNISEALASEDPKNAAAYRQNALGYTRKLEVVKAGMISALNTLKDRNIVTFHEAFPYFAKELNLNVVGVIEKEPGQEPTAEEMANLIKIIKEKKVKALFTEAQYSPKAAQTIANETGAKLYELDLAVTGPKEASEESYIQAMENNISVLLEALK